MAESITPGSDYDAALWGAAVGVHRGQRFLRVTGRAPGEMLKGLITNSPPSPLEIDPEGRQVGVSVYSALLTAKGRMISDLRVYSEPAEGFLLELPYEGMEGALAHFRKSLPPRLATAEDVSDDLNLMTLLGPEVPSLLPKALYAMGCSVSLEGMNEMAEGEEFVFQGPDGEPARLVGSGDTQAKGWHLVVAAAAAEPLWVQMDALGAISLTERTMETLRVEKGRPMFGKDMDEDTIPVEAGIDARAIDHEKGCYTGQEVIVRIRDRGQVNKRLRGVLLGDASPPKDGTPMFQSGRDKEAGWITSAVLSPALGQTIALGFLRRGVEPGDVVAVGGPDGPQAQVRALSDQGWVLD